MEGNPDFRYMSTVTANGFVELISSDAELFGPVGNIRCRFRIDLFRITAVDGDALLAKTSCNSIVPNVEFGKSELWEASRPRSAS